MKSLHPTIFASTAMLALCSLSFVPQARALVQPAGVQTAPDNSAQNKDQGLTADNQSNARADREATANIRKALLADKDLSTYAHNVKEPLNNRCS